jgi:hypothetical protein
MTENSVGGVQFVRRPHRELIPEDSEDVIEFTIFVFISRQDFLKSFRPSTCLFQFRLYPFFSLLHVDTFRVSVPLPMYYRTRFCTFADFVSFLDGSLNRILWAYEAVTTSTTVRACWEKASFAYQRRDGTLYLAVHEGKTRTAPNFQEIWERDYPIGSLSARRKD